MKIFPLTLSLTGCLMVSTGTTAAPATIVDDTSSLRAALYNGANNIMIKPSAGNFMLDEPLEYTGTAPLSIKGAGQIIYDDGLADGEPLLRITEGADLSISRLSFAGKGNYSIENRGGGKGIYVKVPEHREGIVRLKLTQVTVSNTGNHGVHVSDCSLDDNCGGGEGGGGDGSAASIEVYLNKVTIDGAGFGKQDADGLRVDDRGDGDIMLTATHSTFNNVGGDGIELDEGDNGSVHINVRNSHFQGNGAYCSDEFVTDPISLDPACDDDGDPDVDDAFDIDEAGAGSISGSVTNVILIDNYDEGLDFDSAGEGDDNTIDLDIINIQASGNGDEAIKVSEEGSASVVVNLRALDIAGDVEIEEENSGDLQVSVHGSFIGDDLKLSQEDPGTGTVKLRGTTVVDEKDFVNVDEI